MCVVARRSDGDGKHAQRRNKKARDFTHPFIHKSTLLSRCLMLQPLRSSNIDFFVLRIVLIECLSRGPRSTGAIYFPVFARKRTESLSDPITPFPSLRRTDAATNHLSLRNVYYGIFSSVAVWPAWTVFGTSMCTGWSIWSRTTICWPGNMSFALV